MSALARFFKRKGYAVSGYDKTPSDLTERLVLEGIPVHYVDDPGCLPGDTDNTLVVYTPAVPEGLGELMAAKESGHTIMKRSQVLGLIARRNPCIAVSGTHGKTTVTTLVAHIFTESGEGCTAFMGGISRNYDSNLLFSPGKTLVVEADEYDRSFLELDPGSAVITGIEADHLDSYGSLSSLRLAFKEFAGRVTGILIIKKGTGVGRDDTRAKVLTYHLSDASADFHAADIRRAGKGCFLFDIHYPGGILRDVRTCIPGEMNVENAVAAAALAICHGIPPGTVRSAIGSFLGVKRRLEVHVDTPMVAYVDDYAHHPTAIRAGIAAIRDIFPGRHVTAVFQPHLFSRTKALAAEFGQALSGADRVVLTDIYPAREDPIPGVSPELVFDGITCQDRILIRKDDLLDYVEKEDFDVLVTFGAGDIGCCASQIKDILKKKNDGILVEWSNNPINNNRKMTNK